MTKAHHAFDHHLLWTADNLVVDIIIINLSQITASYQTLEKPFF